MMIHNIDKILVWNCRGAASNAFYRYSKYYIYIYKPSVYMVLETRCDPKKIQKTLVSLGFDEYLVMENQRFVGGLGVAWNKEHLTVDLCKKDTQYMHLHIQSHVSISWFFTFIYASPNDVNQSCLWEDLRRIVDSMQES